jgi:hypothetical protein
MENNNLLICAVGFIILVSCFIEMVVENEIEEKDINQYVRQQIIEGFR